MVEKSGSVNEETQIKISELPKITKLKKVTSNSKNKVFLCFTIIPNFTSPIIIFRIIWRFRIEIFIVDIKISNKKNIFFMSKILIIK